MTRPLHLELPNIFQYKGIVCRQYTANDCASVVEVVNHAFAYQDDAKGSPRTTEEQITEYAEKYDMYVLTKAHTIIGCIYTSRTDTILRFGLLALAEEYRGIGLGDTIVKAVLELGKSSYCTAVQLDYLSVAPWLKPYYEKHGFTETGKTEEWRGLQMIQMQKLLT